MVRVRFRRRWQASSIAIVALLACQTASRSADLPTHKEPISPLTPTPAYSWAGAYIGVNAGYGFGQQGPLGVVTNKYDDASLNVNGGVFGGTAGLQLQQGHVVLGVEGDLDWTNISGSKTLVPTIGGAPQSFQLTLKSQTDWLSTGRVRFGWAQDNWLFYGTAGVAMTGFQPRVGSIIDTRTGAALSCADVSLPNCNTSRLGGGLAFGGGVEYGFTPNWSAKAEYIYIAQLQGASTQNLNLLRVGLNYRFGGN
jgi:outer membrane immunogenic protein